MRGVHEWKGGLLALWRCERDPETEELGLPSCHTVFVTFQWSEPGNLLGHCSGEEAKEREALMIERVRACVSVCVCVREIDRGGRFHLTFAELSSLQFGTIRAFELIGSAYMWTVFSPPGWPPNISNCLFNYFIQLETWIIRLWIHFKYGPDLHEVTAPNNCKRTVQGRRLSPWQELDNEKASVVEERPIDQAC